MFVLKDAMELDQLISYLINKENSNGVVLLGHSTGCQVCASAIIILPSSLLSLKARWI